MTIINVINVIILFGILVFIHEFGHFLAAKFFGVKVEKFSLGFGPKIFSFTLGDTEYLLSLIPLGGYVRMLGENPQDEYTGEAPERAFSNQHVLKRMTIVFLGPLFNLLLPLFLFSIVYLIGWPYIPAFVGEVVPGSPADKAGFKHGDTITSIDGQPVEKWDDMTNIIKKSVGRTLDIEVERNGIPVRLHVQADENKGITEFGEMKLVGKIGVSFVYPKATVGISDPHSLAGQSGLVSGDEIVAIDDKPIASWPSFVSALLGSSGRSVSLKISRNERTLDLSLDIPEGNLPLKTIGIHPIDQFLKNIEANSPGEKAGFQKDDNIISVNGAPLNSWTTQNLLASIGPEPLDFLVERGGERKNIIVTPVESNEKDPLYLIEKSYHVGITFHQAYVDVTPKLEQHFNPFTLIAASLMKTIEISKLTVIGLGKLLIGEVSLKTVGGPILIYTITSKVRDFLEYIRLIAFLSITLGIINLLPIPVLDGGHLMFFTYELLRGKPMNTRVWEMAQRVGFTLLIMLIVLTFYNDIKKIWF